MTTLKHTPPPVTTNHLQSQKVDCGCEPGWVMNSDLLFPLIYESIPQEIKTHKCNLFKGIFSVIIYSPSNLHIPTTLDPIDFHCIDKKEDTFQNIFFCTPQKKIGITLSFLHSINVSMCHNSKVCNKNIFKHFSSNSSKFKWSEMCYHMYSHSSSFTV